jgi:hypothetical protein
MKKLVAILLAALLAIAPMAALAEGVTLTMGSWRNTDASMVEALLAKYKELTGVTIVFEPTQSSQYNSVLRMRLTPARPGSVLLPSYATARALHRGLLHGPASGSGFRKLRRHQP